MAPLQLDRDQIDSFVHAVGERLEGEWLLVGGGAAALWFRADRVTEDIDLFGLQSTNRERADLLDLAAAVSLPLEVVNTTADYFVQRVSDWRQMIEVLHRGTRSVVYRPNGTLFLLLKCARMSESDLGDCLALLEQSIPVDKERVIAAVRSLPASADASVIARREQLLQRLC